VTPPAIVLMAGFSFVVAAFFWVACIVSPVRMTKILGFWYAVVFNNVGYLLLVVESVTSF
jgi:hypothetical protein